MTSKDDALFATTTVSLEKIEALNQALVSQFPALEAARQAYAADRTDARKSDLDRLQRDVEAANAAFREAVGALGELLGVDPDAVVSSLTGDRVERTSRASLTQDRLAPTATIDDLLPAALDALLSRLPKGWLDAETGPVGLEALLEPDAILSITKGMRPDSEAPTVHRFRQALRISQDFLADAPGYDHFAGATLAPTITKLGGMLDALSEVGGSPETRLAKLWAGPSIEVDSTVFEVLTGAACAERGRDIEFIPEQSGRKTADLKCHDPYPMVIECKRQKPFAQYELTEDQAMRTLFRTLREACRRVGLYGAFELRLTAEAVALPVADVVAALIGQRLAPDPSRAQAYPFGSIALRPSTYRVALGREHRAYSPGMLKTLFGWETDLPLWDGLCCSIDTPEARVDAVHGPIALLWTNDNETAATKRAWTAAGLFGSATLQVPPGSFGMAYIAYTEGGRESVADRRLERFATSLREWEHDQDIRIPLITINRLYPRALGEGLPDLIESAVRVCSDAYGGPEVFSLFPATVFTQAGDT